MRKGWLAFLASVILHGGVLGAFCLLPGNRPERNPPTYIEEGSQEASENNTTFLVSTETMEISAPGHVPEIPDGPPVLEGPAKPSPVPAPSGAGNIARSTNIGPAPGPGPASNPGGVPGGAVTTFFSVPAGGQKVVYLIDASASMGLHGALKTACLELWHSVQHLPETVDFQVVFFNRTAFPLLAQYPDWLRATPQTLATVQEALRSLPAEGGTDPYRALKDGLSRQPAVLFFLTDAGDFHEGAVGEVTRFNRGHSVIHVIELSDGRDGTGHVALQRLAHDNGGIFRMVSLPPHLGR